MVSFLLNRGTAPRRAAADPNLTMLEYLRAQGLTGVKEGCASGDCGACAVAAAADDGCGGLRYDVVHSCICPAAALHARHIITVEGLEDEGGRLHPAQQAMVDCHGSQCGFCTPGFVISLFVHAKNNGGTTHEELTERLSGNLCRCTGYRPILDAGRALARNRKKDWFERRRARTARLLRELGRRPPGNPPQYYAPRTVRGLAALLAANPRIRILAGGTDIMLEATQQLRQFESLAFIGGIAAMSTIRETRREWNIGGGATFADMMNTVAAHPQMEDLRAALSRFGSPQIRARATVGGNIANASPVADGPPALLALDAVLALRRGDSVRRLPLAQFYRGYKKTALRPGEFIERIIVPKPHPQEIFRMYKVSKRADDDIAAVCAAFKFAGGDEVSPAPRIAFGGMAAVPARARKCELAWKKSGRHGAIEPVLRALSEDFQPISDARAGAVYRAAVAANLLRKARCGMRPEFFAAETSAR
ncbi:MAG: xanthine dehydrogenase small subunit [Gammaproteobacteria bacterium]